MKKKLALLILVMFGTAVWLVASTPDGPNADRVAQEPGQQDRSTGPKLRSGNDAGAPEPWPDDDLLETVVSDGMAYAVSCPLPPQMDADVVAVVDSAALWIQGDRVHGIVHGQQTTGRLQVRSETGTERPDWLAVSWSRGESGDVQRCVVKAPVAVDIEVRISGEGFQLASLNVCGEVQVTKESGKIRFWVEPDMPCLPAHGIAHFKEGLVELYSEHDGVMPEEFSWTATFDAADAVGRDEMVVLRQLRDDMLGEEGVVMDDIDAWEASIASLERLLASAPPEEQEALAERLVAQQQAHDEQIDRLEALGRGMDTLDTLGEVVEDLLVQEIDDLDDLDDLEGITVNEDGSFNIDFEGQ